MLVKLSPDLHVLYSVIVEFLHTLVKVIQNQVFVIDERLKGFELLGERCPNCINIWVGDLGVVYNNREILFEGSIYWFVSKQSSQNFYFNPEVTAFCSWLRLAIREPSKDEVFARLVVAAEEILTVGDVASADFINILCERFSDESAFFAKT